VIERVIRRFKAKFPYLKDLEFIQYWPGLIDTTRDLFPTVLRDERAPWVHYVLGCVGLPWAAFCGDFAARHVLDTDAQTDHRYYRYFAPNRPFFLPLGAERVLGKPSTARWTVEGAGRVGGCRRSEWSDCGSAVVRP